MGPARYFSICDSVHFERGLGCESGEDVHGKE